MVALSQTTIRKRLFIYLIISVSVLFTLISLVLSPIISTVSSNIIYKNTLLPDVLILLTDILNLIALSVCSAIIIYSIVKLGMSASSTLIVTYITAVFLKYSVDMAISYLLFNTIDISVITSYVVAFLIDFLIILLIAFFSYRASRKGKSMMVTAIISAILLSLFKVVSRVIYDISYGAPTDLTDFLWMVIYYTSDILVGVAFAGISLVIFKFLNKKKKTAD